MKKKDREVALPDDPLWYKDAIIYQVHVRAFHDQDGDGVGDFAGLTEKLDYLQKLGISAIWLMPFYPSPLRDDGYDIADYHGVHPLYGKLRDFEGFLKEAHRRGIRIITELVINHTSDQHPWFLRSRREPPGSKFRDFYVWSSNPTRYRDARIIFKDFESSNWAYDPLAKAYYWHRFYSHQPDLNFDNPAVKRAVFRVLDFWLGMGVDGLRLDAVPYLIEREGTDCENLPETHTLLRDLRRYVDRKYKNRMLLAEANQWPEDAAAYFGNEDECHMNFHFPLMPRLFMAVQMEDRFPIIDILQQTPSIGESSQWALFLRNHDELTLEMVTDEERDYMYRSYAHDQRARINLGIRRRLAPLLGNSRRRIELLNALLLSLPGTPVIYYGDEIGMGDNIYLGDRNGVRTPMQWSADRNAGFSRANPQSLYLPVIIDSEYHYETVNVEAQLNNPHSLLWWQKRMMALRKRFQAFGRGSIEFLHPDNRKVLAFVRRYEKESVLVVANLSRLPQYTRLNLSSFKGLAPVEMHGRTEFPPIGEEGYFLSFAPHAFFWFTLEEPRAAEWTPEAVVPDLAVRGSWEQVLSEGHREKLERLLPSYLKMRRWFGGKAKRIENVNITDVLSLPRGEADARLVLLSVEYAEDQGETYLLPLTYATGTRAESVQKEAAHAVVSRIRVSGGGTVNEGLLYDASYDPDFAVTLIGLMDRRRRVKGMGGTGTGFGSPLLRRSWNRKSDDIKVKTGSAEQTNTSIILGDRFILKLFRRVEEGVNPDLEIGRFLSGKARFEHTPAVAGHLEYQRGKRVPVTLGILHRFVPNEGDAWQFTLDEVVRFLERALSRFGEMGEVPVPTQGPLELAEMEIPELARDAIGVYLESARLLGQRTAELHLALASEDEDPAFSPEFFTPFYRRALSQSMRNLTGKVVHLLEGRLSSLPEPVRNDAKRILKNEKEIVGWFQATLRKNIKAVRIRTHGDYHLGQVLYTGNDFFIIDFEGEPARSIEERRLKLSPLRDVAGMLRSFHYAAHTALHGRVERRLSSESEGRLLPAWTQLWHLWVSACFLKAYLERAVEAPFLVATPTEDLRALLNVYRMEKAIYELGYELNNRPPWVSVPLAGISQIWSELQGEG